MPETKQLPLEEMNLLFSGPWFVPTAPKRVGESELEARVRDARLEKHDNVQVENAP